MHNRYFIVLTALLLIVGGLLVVQSLVGGGDTTFVDQASYTIAREAGDIPERAPELPPCAEQISVVASRSDIESITFSCADANLRESFVSELKKDFSWNVLIFDGGRVHLSPAGSQ